MKKLIVTLLFFPAICFPEYRVYQYNISPKLSDKEKPQTYQKVSTLDPVSFVAYNGGAGVIKVDLLRTWRCPGNTSNKKRICPPPLTKLLQKLEAEDGNQQP